MRPLRDVTHKQNNHTLSFRKTSHLSGGLANLANAICGPANTYLHDLNGIDNQQRWVLVDQP